jgi:hypothetical protein
VKSIGAEGRPAASQRARMRRSIRAPTSFRRSGEVSSPQSLTALSVPDAAGGAASRYSAPGGAGKARSPDTQPETASAAASMSVAGMTRRRFMARPMRRARAPVNPG